jgi:hypothetical protein
VLNCALRFKNIDYRASLFHFQVLVCIKENEIAGRDIMALN